MASVHSRIFGVVLAAHCVVALAQTTVYESKDKAGPVYSDKPLPSATPVDLPPPNVIELPKMATPAAPAPVSAAAPAYRSLAIVSLKNGDTIHSNTGAFEFSARTQPALRAGDRIRVRLDGHFLSSSFRSTSLRVSEADWTRAARAESVGHTLQLAVVDAAGAVLIESAPVSLYVQRASVARPQR